IQETDRVVEIGAGAGSLTLGLAAAAAHVIALEVDPSLIAVLEETLEGVENVETIHADALTYDLSGLDATKLVGNLPYNVAAQLVLRALEHAPQLQELTVMTQREVGERLAAIPGSKTYGLTSVLVAYFGRAEVVTRISRHVFYPAPNVDSVLVRIVRRSEVPDVDRAVLFAIVRAAFSQRRKTMRNNLATVTGSVPAAERALVRSGIDAGARGETLSLEDFVRLTDAINHPT
ncbi:MAG: 16S rRNA (adenine(1518)-N(6)/adenine(1519)-N(6))-dimethyltransferase RsmA, partial [Actinomycetota bacterium]|nr:16S rRNA (adenine(1518)-N(6)/adenine(1519)-N(6))-dimethyltransferase RsmA [Actinomycetota bacterium]